MDLRQLKHFVVLAETLHFGRASDLCHISISAFSRGIRQLEDSLGVELFLRDNRSVALTHEGSLFLEYAREALGEWEVAASGGNHYGGSRFSDTLDVNAKTVAEVAAALAPLGVADPSVAFLKRVAGTWVSDDFEEQERITKQFDVTELLEIVVALDTGAACGLGGAAALIVRHGLRDFADELAAHAEGSCPAGVCGATK